MGIDNTEYVNPTGISGGPRNWWMNEISAMIPDKENNFIDCKVSSDLVGGDFYTHMGLWRSGLRKEITKLGDVERDRGSPKRNMDMWGDFNDIIHHR